MLDENVGYKKPTTTDLYLVEPTTKLGYQFATLRNLLDRNRIPFITILGYEGLIDLLNGNSDGHKNIIVVNSTDINEREIPKQISNRNNNEIYFYPNYIPTYDHFLTADTVINTFKNKSGMNNNNNSNQSSTGLQLRSIKKDLQHSQQRQNNKQVYQRYMIMSPKTNHNIQYINLYNLLQNYNPRIIPISKQNQIMNYRETKSLLVLEKQSLDSINQLVNGNRMRNLDLAVLGQSKMLGSQFKKYAILTQDPLQIITYLQQSGLSLQGAQNKYNLIRQTNLPLNTNHLISQPNSMRLVGSEQDLNIQYNTLNINQNMNTNNYSTAPQNNMIGHPNMNVAINSNAFANNPPINNSMNINPNINNGAMIVTPPAQKPKVIKKIKGNGPNSLINSPNMNESQQQSIRLKNPINLENQIEVDQRPINPQNQIQYQQTVQSNQNNQTQYIQNNPTLQLTPNFGSGKKNVMQWYLKPNNQKSMGGNYPSFTLSQQPQISSFTQQPQVSNNSINSIQKQPIIPSPSSSHIPTFKSMQNNQGKPIMNWNLFPVNFSNGSNKISFNLMNQDANFINKNQLGSAPNISSSQTFKQFSNQNISGQVLPVQPNIPQTPSQPQIQTINQANNIGNIPQAPIQNGFNLKTKQQMSWYVLPNLAALSQNQQLNSGQNKIPFQILSQQEMLMNNQQNLQNAQSYQNIPSGQSFKQLPNQNNPVQVFPIQPQPQAQSINQAPSIGNIAQAPLQNGFVINSKPQMDWHLHPSNGQISKQQGPNNNSKIPFELISEQELNKNKQNNTINSINSMIQSKKQPPKPPQHTSKQSISIDSNKIISQEFQQNITSQRIQNKYNKQLNLNLIKQSSDEHHGSHMSFPIDQTQRISINKNSNRSINLQSQNYINQAKIQQQLQRAQYQNKNAKSQQIVIPVVPYDQPKRLLPQAPQTYYIQSTKNIQNTRINNTIIPPAISISQNMKRSSLPINQVTTTTITNTNSISNPSYTNYGNYKIEHQPIPRKSQTVTYTYNINNPPINQNKEIKFNTNTENTVNIINTTDNYNYGKYMGQDTSRAGSHKNSNIVDNQSYNQILTHTNTHGDRNYQHYYTNYYNSKGNNDFYDVSTDQNGNRFYRIKRHYLNNPNTYLNQNPTTTQTLDRYKSAPKPQIVTYTTHNPKIEPSIPLSPRQPIRRQSNFNINDYQEHIDDKGRKYYKAKQSITNKLGTNLIGQSKKIQQSFKLQHIQTPQQYKSPSQTLMIESKNQSIANRHSPNYSPNFSTSSQYTDNNHKYTNYTRQQIRHSTYESPNTAIDKYQRRFTNTNPGTFLPIKAGVQQKIMNKLLGKNDNIKVEEYSKKNVTKPLTNPTQQYLNNNIDVYNEYHHQNQTHHHHHHHKHINRASKLKNSNNEIVSDRNTIRDSRNSNTNHLSPNQSKLSRESLNIDSRSVSMTGNKNLYGDKPYFSSTANVRIQNYSQLQKATKQFKNLDVGGNYFHYIVYNKHPMKKQILSSAGVQDKVIQIQHRDQVYEFMEKKPFPNQFYDAGLIFIDHNPNFQHQIQPSKIINGYYIIDIDSSNPQIDIKKQRKSINISNVRNLPLVKKLLLAPSIQHFIFYPRGNDADISKVLSLFPSKKFQKYSYSNKLQLETHLNMHLKNRNRLTRILIFVNQNNINEIAPVLDHNLNNKSFTMICNSRGPAEESYKNQYKRIKFFDNFDFNSYGSVMSLANGEDGVRHSRYSTPRQQQQFKQSKFQRVSVNSSEYSPEKRNSPQPYSLPRPKIYIQRPHTGIDKQIQKSRPGIYQIQYFNNPSEIKQASRDNYVLLHGQADNIGQKFNRDMGMIILFGPGNEKKQRISDGVINIEKVSQLINSVL